MGGAYRADDDAAAALLREVHETRGHLRNVESSFGRAPRDAGAAVARGCKFCAHTLLCKGACVALSVTVLYVMSGIVVTVLGLVGGVPGGETPRVADLSAAGAGRFFHNSVLS